MTTQEILFSFKGRIGRGTFLKWWLVLTAFTLVGLGIDMAVSGKPGWVWRIFGLVQLWPSLAIFTKRWHDRNRSLWLVLLILIPFVGILALLWLMIETLTLKGTEGENKSGHDPLQTQTGEVQQRHPTKSTGQDYVTKCMVENYREQDELRSWNSDPAFRRVLDPLNAGQNVKARNEAEAFAQKFPDFADVYVWWAKAFLSDRNYPEARRVLRDGLSKSKQKYPLLNLMGEVEWKSGSLEEAVYWWIQGLICQQTRRGFGEEVGAYLYLYHVADALGLSTLATQLCERVDFIRPGRTRLSSEAINSLTGLIGASDTAQIRKVLQMVEKKYFVPKPQTGSSKQDDEIPALIRIAQDSSAGYDARGKAIQRLAEVGDSRAIGPLMQIYNTELHLIRLDAKDAVDKIRARGR